MTRPIVPFTIRNGGTLNPSVLQANLDQAAKDIQDSLDQRYFYSDFYLDFTGLASATSLAEEFKFFIKPPFYWEIVGIELEVYVAAANVSAVTIQASGAGLVGWEDVSATPLGATTRARGEGNFVASNTAATEVGFTLAVTSTGAYTLDACRVVVHIRTDRGNAGASHAGYTPMRIASGDSVSHTALDADLALSAAAVVRDTTNDKQMRISVHMKRALPTGFSTALRDVRVPSSGRRLNTMDVVALAAATNNLTVEYQTAAGTVLATGTANGAGTGTPSKTYVTSGLPVTQAVDAPATDASDHRFRFSRSGAGVADLLLSYVVAYWT